MKQPGEHGTLCPERIVLSDAEPVFLVGCPRSGTTALLSALREGAGLPGFKEGNLPALLAPLVQAVRGHYRGLPEDYLARRDAHLIANIEREWLEVHILNYFAMVYREHMGPGLWVDKSANGEAIVRSCTLLAQIFPRARFVFCKRRGIENVLSRQRKFPDDAFGNHCRVWARTMQAWLEVEPHLRRAHLEIDQRDSATRPDVVAQELGELIGLGEAQVAGVERYLRSSRPEQTRTAQDVRPIALAETGWSGAERAEFQALCAEMMAAFGYDEDGDVPASPLPIQLFYPEVDGAVEKRDVIAESWGFRRVGANGFQLHPNPPGSPPAEIRYPGVVLAGHGCFSSTLRLGDRRAESVRFGVRIEPTSGHGRVVAFHEDVTADADRSWSVEFEPLHGSHDIVLSTQMTATAKSANCAAAQWIDPRLS